MTEDRQTDKVALVGTASPSRDDAPWDDPSFEIWGLAWTNWMKRCDRAFDIHPLHANRKKVPKNYKKHLQTMAPVVYLQEAHPEVPNSTTYPKGEVESLLAKYSPLEQGNYFASSISYMLALAIYLEFKEIHLYGIDLLDDSEYVFQRPNAEYLVGLARGMGIKVFVPETSALLKYTHDYGYETQPDVGIINLKMLQDRKKQYEEKKEHALATARTCDGAIQEIEQQVDYINRYLRGGYIEEEKEGSHGTKSG